MVMVVGSGTTTVWCGVMFVPNLLLLIFYSAYAKAYKGKAFRVQRGWV